MAGGHYGDGLIEADSDIIDSCDAFTSVQPTIEAKGAAVPG